MKIHILCNDGSPLDKLWTDIHEDGVGGAELALLSLSEQFVKDGHDVTIFNQTQALTKEQAGIKFAWVNGCPSKEKDRILIVFRSPNHRIAGKACKQLIWWSTDQYTVGNFRKFAAFADFIVTISPYHKNYLQQVYNISDEKMAYIDLGVRDEYALLEDVEKQRNLCIFCSVPDRGLSILYQAWPLILARVPDAKLIITSDYRLWGWPSPRNHEHRLLWANAPNVDFLGRVTREELIKLQLASELQIYPCTYDELFCLSVAECSVSGAYPITSALGALPTTNEWGTVLNGDPQHPQFMEEFVERAVSLLTGERAFLEEQRQIMSDAARERFLWPHIAQRWYELFEEGRISND